MIARSRIWHVARRRNGLLHERNNGEAMFVRNVEMPLPTEYKLKTKTPLLYV